MASTRIHDERIRALNDEAPRKGRYVLYWMQQSARAEQNHALEYAIQRANDMGLGLLVGFGLWDGYPDANARHFAFLLEGLAETAGALERRGIGFVVQRGEPAKVALGLAGDAALVVCDRGYLRHQRAWRRELARRAGCEVVQVESDAVVPVDVASDKAEYGARTLRPKIQRNLDEHLVELRTTALEKDSTNLGADALDVSNPARVLESLKVDRSVAPVSQHFRGGTSHARAVLRRFLDERFPCYAKNRNQPQTDDVSYMGMYLHYGQISPLAVALAVREAEGGSREDRESYLEELVVRRELSLNFVEHMDAYDSFSCLPDWAKQTLRRHSDDDRPHRYTRRELEAAETHDPYWNAAMNEMKHTGYMHNYMRMYWGKKILEWCNTPEYAHRTTLELNNKYFLDGRDANSYAGVAWIFGQHDRPWPERKIFGKVRYMSAGGLERKCDIDAYVEKVHKLMG